MVGLWVLLLFLSNILVYFVARILLAKLGWVEAPKKKEIIRHTIFLLIVQSVSLFSSLGLLLAYSDWLDIVYWPGILILLFFADSIFLIIVVVIFAFLEQDYRSYIKPVLLIMEAIFSFIMGWANWIIPTMRDFTFYVSYEYTALGVAMNILSLISFVIILMLLIFALSIENPKIDFAVLMSIILLLFGIGLSNAYPAQFAVEGIIIYWLGTLLAVSGFVYLMYVTIRLHSRRVPKTNKRVVVALSLILIVIIAGVATLGFIRAVVAKNGMSYVWDKKIQYTVNISEVPIVVDNLRLIDRDLAKDFISTFSLPSPPTGWRIEKLLEYEAEGVVEGKLAWIVPIKYQTVISKGKETNKIAGFIWIYINDTPLPENIMYEYYEMDIGPGLESFRDLSLWFKCRFPYYALGEFYPVKIDGKWYWVLLADKLIGNIYFTDKIILVESFNKYKVLTLDEALALGIPQVISSKALASAITEIGNYLRKGEIDYTAVGVPLLVPESPDRIIPLSESFYNRPHHFLINNGSWFGRDFYMMVRLSEKMKSVVLVTLINKTMKIIDLRGYKRGELQGVNSPTSALSVLERVADQTIGEGRVVVRYPKLYRFNYDNQTVLVWLALLVEELPGGDILRGAVFVDAVDTRIKGVIQYTFGEPRSVFISRLKQYIELTYKSFQQGNQTTVRTGKIRNGTIVAKGWAFEGSGSDMSFILTFRVLNGSDIVIVVAKEEYMESKEQWYLATTVKEGEHVDMDLRFDPERQVWMLYRIAILD